MGCFCDRASLIQLYKLQVELIEIINKPLLLHLVGYLYYWKMGFNSVFKGLREGCEHGRRRWQPSKAS